MKYIEFVAVENITSIVNNYDYVKTIFDKIVDAGFVSTIAVIPGTKSVSEITEYDDESTCFSADFNSLENGKSNVWKIFFQFGTFDKVLHLQISISSDTYSVAAEDDYLERLKLFIKQTIIRDWTDIIWLLDVDSQCLSESLYPDLYSVENKLRRLINTVMVKVYGIQWWDLFVPYSIREKHKSRLAGYKSAVPGFCNVDEKLMSIDVGDLFTIVTLERTKWSPNFDDEISSQLSGMLQEKPDKIIELLKKQLVKEVSLWDKWFSKYLPESFKSDFKNFEIYRNHIAHNKLIDRSSYRKIKTVINTLQNNVDDAIKKAETDILSAEDKLMVEREREEYLQMLEECERENKENDAGVSIRTYDEIEDILSDSVGDVISYLSESLCFREDIEIQIGDYGDDQIAFIVTSKITDDVINVKVSYSICDEEGSESSVTLSYGEEESVSICYKNGEVEYDYDQALYMPITQDELSESDIEDAKQEILEYINDITDIKEKAHSAIYSIVKDGGEPPVNEDMECSECGENEISVDESFAPVGTCLNCGCVNNVVMCDRCGTWFNADLDGLFEEDGAAICQNCIDEIDEE